MSRAVLFAPGRGSYTEASLRQLPGEHPWVHRAEELRAEIGLSSLLELDRAERFRASQHLAPANVSPLIYLLAMLDAERALAEHEIVAVGGNSMGWYTALAVAGALSFEDGFRLVQKMAILQHEHAKTEGGGQILYPLVDEDWQAQPAYRAAVDAALASGGGNALPSILLGGYAVLAGTDEGLAHLMRQLPPVELGRNRYPFKLVQHGPYHTPWQAPVAERARRELSGIEFRAPRVTLIDGRGARFTPWSSDPVALRSYTLGAQVTEPYDLTSSIRVALREYAPDHLVMTGPGNTLGGVCGQVLVAEGYRGLRARADLAERDGERLLISMSR